MLTVRVIGQDGKPLKINGEGEITASIHTHPPIDEKVEALPFRAYFTNSSNSSDMRVDGSTTPVEFSIDADADYDYWIKSISVKLADAGAKFNLFGAITALTNGVDFEWQNQETGTLVIHDGIKDNLEWFRLSNVPVTTASIVDLSGGGADSIVVHIDLAALFGNPWGIRLVKGRTDRLLFRVNDSISASSVDEFNIIAYGIKV